jgi:hypothetical protein
VGQPRLRGRAPGALGVATLLALASCAPREATPPQDAGAPAFDAAATLALRPYFRDLRTIRVAIAGDTVELLFDTGGGETLITPALAAAIGCTPSGRSVGHRMSGEPVVFQHCDSVAIDVGGTRIVQAPVAVFDVNALLPTELPRLGGVLALDAFRGTVLTLDWASGRVRVHDRATADSAAAGGLPVRFATGTDGASLAALVRVEGRRGPLWLLLDSGNLRGTLLAEHVPRDSLLAVRDGRVTLRIGARDGWSTNFAAVPLILDGALGTDFLLRAPVSLDLRRAPLSPRR